MISKMLAAVMAFVMSVAATLHDGYESFKNKVERVAHGDRVFVESGMQGMYTPQLPGELQADGRGQLGFQTIIAAVSVVIAVMLAVIIVDRFDSSLGTPNSSELENASNSVLSGFADMAGLVGPLLVAAIAVVIIALVRRAQG